MLRGCPGARSGSSDASAANAPYMQLYYDQYMPPAVGSVINDSVQELFAASGTPQDVAKAIEASAATELK